MPTFPPILFLHGLATTSKRTWGDNGWFDLVRDAEREFLPVDLPGHGKEYIPSSEFNGNLVDYVHDRIPFPIVDGIGFSLGARVLLELALKKPGKFRKLVLAGVGDSIFESDQIRGKKISDAISGEGNLEDPESRYFSQLSDYQDIDGKYIAKYLQTKNSSIDPSVLSGLKAPVLIVLGENDFAGPATRLIDSLPNAKLVMLKGVDHFATPKDFSFLESALDFLDSAPNW